MTPTQPSYTSADALPRGECERRISEAETHLFQALGWLQAAKAEAERYGPSHYQDTIADLDDAMFGLRELLSGNIAEALAAVACEQEAAEESIRRRGLPEE
jgi:hypothetical protein